MEHNLLVDFPVSVKQMAYLSKAEVRIRVHLHKIVNHLNS